MLYEVENSFQIKLSHIWCIKQQKYILSAFSVKSLSTKIFFVVWDTHLLLVVNLSVLFSYVKINGKNNKIKIK